MRELKSVRAIKAVERLTGFTASVAFGIAGFAVVLMVAVFTYEIVARYFFNRPTGFADQLTAALLPLVALFAAARTLRQKGHVNVDILVNKLSPRRAEMVQRVVAPLVLLAVFALLVLTTRTVFESYELKRSLASSYLVIPLYIPQIILVIGFLFLFLEAVHQTLVSLRRIGDSSQPDSK